ncbi:MAG: hypothetical protein ABRQ39_30975, partial [Candidatus Eremiobacterota bacterium]
MNWFILWLLAVILYLAGVGWATHTCYHRGTPDSEKFFRAMRALIIAGLFLMFTFMLNYFLASTGLGRTIRNEKLASDAIGKLLFNGSGLKSNNLLALIMVCMSFISVGGFLYSIERFLDGVKNRIWKEKKLELIIISVGVIVATLFMG